MSKSPYKEAIMYLEGLIIMLNSLENKENEALNIGILKSVHDKIGALIANLEAMI